MKKIIALALITLTLTGCNAQIIDTTWKYDWAVISMPDGSTVSGTVESWTDYEDGDQIQVKIDGKTYLTHASRVVLIGGKNHDD